MKLFQEMKEKSHRPTSGIFVSLVDTMGKAGRLDTAMKVYMEMQGFGLRASGAMFVSLIESFVKAGKLETALRLWDEMKKAGFETWSEHLYSSSDFTSKKKLVDVAAKILLEMKAMGYSVEVNASDVLMVYIKDGSVDLALRCQEEHNERHLMSILSATKHKAHAFLCGLFTGPEQRKQPVLSFVREFFQGIDYELEEGAARYFVNVLLNYLVLMGQINRARCVWKVAYENKLFPKAIVFDQHIAWSLDVRNLSVGAALIASCTPFIDLESECCIMVLYRDGSN
ncbi:UNVERIFIED_CONTAM: Pentatricopeptide repeat-containing protein, mitochondrial [Sesamum radiatum]|uniref:Pentatricopeptide repeat-containing protein, mitochondrial n=1 Tax=Sesamum radiatum TaxID=300843 RepID=A0AAW2KJD8_SESRA